MTLQRSRRAVLSSNPLLTLLVRLGVVLLVFTLSRWLYLLFNHQTLLAQSHPLRYWLWLFVGGLRFDLSAIFVVNSLFIVLSLLPLPFTRRVGYRKTILVVCYYLPNIFAFATDAIDMIYSRFTQKRMTFDVVRFLDTGDGFASLIPQFLSDYWYVLLTFLATVALFIWLNRRLKIGQERGRDEVLWRFVLCRTVWLVLMVGVSVVAIRGGFQLRPIGVITATRYAEPSHISLVLNTPFTLIKTVDDSTVDRKHYFTEDTLKHIYYPVYQGVDTLEARRDNVVVIILEGVTAEYSALLNPRLDSTFTPCLDAIARQGVMLPAYANGTRSMEGVPAILAGVPTLMDNEYLTSIYSGNQITSLPSVLKRWGYRSAFFHGGKNGTMNFDAFTWAAQFDDYFGKDEYSNDADYDGTWGIYDEPFLQYVVHQLDTFSTPFFSSVFLLSSHHPYALPDDYRQRFSVREEGMPAVVRYSDWALGRFFEAAAERPWFRNTLFVILSDHASHSNEPHYNTPAGKYEIPMVWYHAGQPIPAITKPFAQQMDVLPSVVDYLHLPDTLFAFGKSVFGADKPFAISYLNHVYQLITEDFVIRYAGDQPTEMYRRTLDGYSGENLLPECSVPSSLDNLFKGVLQTYNNSLIDNKLTIERYE